MTETKGTYSLTRYQAIAALEALNDSLFKSDNMILSVEYIDVIQKALDENQSLPQLEPFVWHEATPENCERIPKDGLYSVNALMRFKDNSWIDGVYNYHNQTWNWPDRAEYKITHFMLIK